MVPGIVCLSFSVELWFKALGCLSNPAGEVPTGHELDVLFLGLSNEIQSTLITMSSFTRDEFLQAIKADSKAFETWRYSYEWAARQPPSADGLDVMSVNLLLLNTLPDACNQVYEEFK